MDAGAAESRLDARGEPSPAENRLRGALRRIVEHVDVPFDGAFLAANNPLKQLGALGWFFYWVVAGSGIYLYIFFDTGITNAYASVEWLTHDQWYLGGVMRSLHRYASDGLVIVLALHVLRELAKGRYRGARAFSWWSGIPLVALVLASGITGYWLVWDELAQYIAIVTSEWFDGLGIFGEAIARNFMNSVVLSSRFFTLMAFLHIAVPLFLLLGLWIHVQRQSQARVNPSRPLGIATVAGLLVLSFVEPAVSQPPANLDRVAAVIGLDWFYLAAYPLLDYLRATTVWGLAFGMALGFVVVPWLPRRRRAPVAVVDLDNCNGCGRCVADCPFNAIELTPRTDGKPYSHEVAVDADLCTGCNVCMGSCPTATPFRRATALVAGIAVPGHDVAALLARTQSAANALPMDGILAFACEETQAVIRQQGDRERGLAATAAPVAVVQVPCVGSVPPPFVDFVLSRKLAGGVLLAGCAECDCQYRLGGEWTQQRLERRRDPLLRARVPRERIALAWVGHSRKRAETALAELRARGLAPEDRAAESTP
jgi:NAD-dependent dihydropyrimidine dehydrogenase PreA subunit/coenzyme F420-reducing hydrogenase delta subunit